MAASTWQFTNLLYCLQKGGGSSLHRLPTWISVLRPSSSCWDCALSGCFRIKKTRFSSLPSFKKIWNRTYSSSYFSLHEGNRQAITDIVSALIVLILLPSFGSKHFLHQECHHERVPHFADISCVIHWLPPLAAQTYHCCIRRPCVCRFTLRA